VPRIRALACLACVLAAPAAAHAQAETDLSAAEVDALLARLVDPSDMGLRAAALAELLEAQEGALPVLTERLFRPNGITAGLQQRLLEDYVRRLPAELPPDSPVPRRTALAPLLHLLILAPHETYRESWAAALQIVALLAALDVIDTNEALTEAIRFVSLYEGAYARAVGLLVRSKGDRAIPALVRARKLPSGPVREFVANQLARMGKDRAPLMAQVNDDQLLADTLRAIAEVRDSEGVNVMLSFINSDRPFVRQAARESLRLYERNAIWAVRKSYEDLTGEPADTSWGWEETFDRLFAAQDAARLEPLDGLLARGLAAARDGRFDEMDDAFGTILGREPEYPRRAEMVPGLLAYGEQLLAKGGVLEARRILRLAGYLVPQDDARGARIRAHLAYLEGLRRRDLGFPDPDPFREAEQLDPAYAKLIAQRGDLTSLAGSATAPSTPTAPPAAAPAPAAPAAAQARVPAGRIAVAAGIALTALAALFLLVSYGRVPGRLFARGAKPPAASPPRAPSPSPTPTPTPGPGPGADAFTGSSSPSADLEPTAESQEPAPPPSPCADTGAFTGAATPSPGDPYLRIEQALARIRTDVPPPPAPADGGESQRPEDAGPTITPDHDDHHDHDDARSGRRKERGNG
jgi:hypothetical protein